MAVSVNTSTGRGQLYTGMVSMKVLAINPTLEEMNGPLGIPAEKEPKYQSTVKNKKDKDVQQMRVETHFEAIAGAGIPEGLRARLSIFLKYEHVAGMRMNRFGRFSSSPDTDEEFKKGCTPEQIFPVFDGQMDLMLLLEALANPKRGTDFYLDNLPQLIYNGYTKEIQSIVTAASKNTVKCLLGVQVDKQGRYYQTVHKRVQAGWKTNFDNFHKQFQKQQQYNKDTDYGPIGDLYNPADYNLRPWYPSNEAQADSDAPIAAPGPVGGVKSRWPENDSTSGSTDPNSPDYNKNKLPF